MPRSGPCGYCSVLLLLACRVPTQCMLALRRPGSGCIITFLGLLMRDIGHDVILLASDINPAATRATQETAARNGV